MNSNLDISDSYFNFFCDTIGERHVFLQGGRRSGKTWSTFKWLVFLCAAQGGMEVVVLTYEHPQLRATMDDFTKSTGYDIVGSAQHGYNAVTQGGVRWRFISCNDKSKAQGTQCDYLFVNEAVNFPGTKGIIETFSMGVRKQIIYNYNPTKAWEYANTRINGRNLICTTWRDNEENLTQAQRDEFEAMKERAMRKTATKNDIYQYQVYYLGNFANMVGAVFGSVERMTWEQYTQIPAKEVLGMDFGFATDGDPTTLIGCKVWSKRIYFHQYIYERGLTSDEELCRRVYGLGFNEYTTILADYGGMGHGRIDNLRRGGNGTWAPELRRGLGGIGNAIKTQIMDGLSQMLSMDGIAITDCSDELISEFECYERDENGKFHGADHGIDAARYAFTYAHRVL